MLQLDSKKQISGTMLDSSTAPEFAAAAIKWAKDSTHNIKATESKTANEGGVTFTGVSKWLLSGGYQFGCTVQP